MTTTSFSAPYLELELENRCVTGGRLAPNELLLLPLEMTGLEEVLLLPPPATLANCSGVSCLFGSLIVISLCASALVLVDRRSARARRSVALPWRPHACPPEWMLQERLMVPRT